MKGKIILGCILICLSFALGAGSNYLGNQIGLGKVKVEKAQKNVDLGNQILSQNEYSKEIGGVFTDKVQKKIDKGNQDIQKYEAIYNYMRYSMWISGAFGCFLVIIGILNKKKKSS